MGSVRVITHTGAIVSGEFAGSTAEEILTQPSLNIQDCLGSGIKRINGVVKLTILL